MSAGRKFAGLWLLAMFFYYRTAVAIILAVLFAFGCYLLFRIRPIGRARGLWRRLATAIANNPTRIPKRSTIPHRNLAREVAVARRSAWTPISDSMLARLAVKPENAPQEDEFCPFCGSVNIAPKGNTSLRCNDCGEIWP